MHCGASFAWSSGGGTCTRMFMGACHDWTGEGEMDRGGIQVKMRWVGRERGDEAGSMR